MPLSTPGLGRVHADGLIAHLEAAGLTVFDADGPQTPHDDVPYCVVRTDNGRTSGALGDRYRDLRVLAYVTSVGETREQAQGVADQVRAAFLTDTAPTITGRVAHPMWLEASNPVTRDDGVEPPLFYAVDSFRLWTEAT